MNGVQLTFFNFSGYLIPGIVLLVVLGPMFYVYPQLNALALGSLALLGVGEAGLTGAPLVAALFLPVLGFAFLLGTALSDTMSWLFTLLAFDRWKTRSNQPDNFYNLMIDQGREVTLSQKGVAREMIALMATSGWDLYGFAGRARLLSSSGVAMLIGSACYVMASIWAALILFIVGSYLIFLGKRHYDLYHDLCDILAFLEETRVG